MIADYRAIRKKIQKALEKNSRIASVYLFGSFVQGRANEESDLDVGVLFKKDVIPSPKEIFDFQVDLSDAAGVLVDVVCLNSASPILGMQVLKKGEKIIDADPHQTHEFIIRLVNGYDDLKRVRTPIEKNILRGRIYG